MNTTKPASRESSEALDENGFDIRVGDESDLPTGTTGSGIKGEATVDFLADKVVFKRERNRWILASLITGAIAVALQKTAFIHVFWNDLFSAIGRAVGVESLEGQGLFAGVCMCAAIFGVWWLFLTILEEKKVVEVKVSESKATYDEEQRRACVQVGDNVWVVFWALDSSDDPLLLDKLKETFGNKLSLGGVKALAP